MFGINNGNNVLRDSINFLFDFEKYLLNRAYFFVIIPSVSKLQLT